MAKTKKTQTKPTSQGSAQGSATRLAIFFLLLFLLNNIQSSAPKPQSQTTAAKAGKATK